MNRFSEISRHPLFLVLVVFLGFFITTKFGVGFPVSVSQTTTNQSTPFTVTAEGKVNAKPDIAQINLGVQTQGSTVKAAQDEANKIINSVSSGVKNLGINEKDIKTVNYSVYPEEQDSFTETPVLPAPTTIKALILPPTLSFPVPKKVTKYRVNVSLLITVRNLEKINDVIDIATSNGANQVGGINFVVDNIEQYRSEARKIAIDAARTKASEIARQAGITLVKVINVSDGYSNYQPLQMAAAKEVTSVDNSQTRIEPGSSEISVTVTLSYETR